MKELPHRRRGGGGGGEDAIAARLQPMAAAEVDASDLRTVRVREAVAFRVQPARRRPRWWWTASRSGPARRFGGGGFLRAEGDGWSCRPASTGSRSSRRATAGRTSWSRSSRRPSKDARADRRRAHAGRERVNRPPTGRSAGCVPTCRPWRRPPQLKSLPGRLRARAARQRADRLPARQRPGAGRHLGALLPRRHPRRAGRARRRRPLPRAHDVQGLRPLRPRGDRPPDPGPGGRQQRLHQPRLDGLLLQLRRRPLDRGAGHRGRPHERPSPSIPSRWRASAR